MDDLERDYIEHHELPGTDGAAPAPVVELTPDALGQFAYLTYTIGVGSVGYAPAWRELPADERVGWRAAADGVRMLVEMHRNG